MRQHVERHFGFLKTTLLGGVVFLLPLIVVGALLAQAGTVVYGVVEAVQETLQGNEEVIEQYVHLGPVLYASAFAAAVAIVVGACFVAGIVARRSLGRWFTGKAERYLLMLFPRYSVFKDQLTGNLGGGTLRPVLIRVAGVSRIGMEVQRGAAGEVTVYLPGAPDPWSGTVILVPEGEVTPIDAPFADVMATFEQLGRGASKFVQRTRH